MAGYKLDMHIHTKESSGCGKVAAADVVRSYKEAGYDGIMITDHYHKTYFDSLGTMKLAEKTEKYLEGYRRARQEGERLGLDVLLGIEFRNVESDNDFLIVGITEEFLFRYPETYLLPLAKAIDFFHEKGMLVIQAHPVRFGMTGQGEKTRKRICWLQCENQLDGIEVYNGNSGWGQDPKDIEAILTRHPDYIRISASDFHEPRHLARGGIVLDRQVKNSGELKEALQNHGIIHRIETIQESRNDL